MKNHHFSHFLTDNGVVFGSKVVVFSETGDFRSARDIPKTGKTANLVIFKSKRKYRTVMLTSGLVLREAGGIR